MKGFLCAILATIAIAPIYAEERSAPMQSEMSDLDSRIQVLKDKRSVAARNAYLARDKAFRMIDRDWLGYRKAVERQEQCEQEVKNLDVQIAELERKKAELQAK